MDAFVGLLKYLTTGLFSFALIGDAWAFGGPPFRTASPECKPQFSGQAQFAETTANYSLQGTCWDGTTNWTFYGKAAYADGKPVGKGQEGYTFSSPSGNGELQLSMDCITDPWIDNGICSRDSLKISWKGPGSIDALTKLLSYDAGGPIPPPFSASFLRRDAALIKTYQSQRQAYLTKLQQDRQARLTAPASSGVIQGAQVIDLMYRPTILSPAEGSQYVLGKTILLMVKPPERGVLGSTLRVVYQYCTWNSGRSACDWGPGNQEPNVSSAQAQAGAYQLKSATKTGQWRINIVNSADGVESPWRNFSIITIAQQAAPTRAPVFGR